MKNTQQYLIYGKHSALSVLNNSKRQIDKVLCTRNTAEAVKNLCHYTVVDHITLERTLKDNGYHNALHQDIIVFTHRLKQPDLYTLLDKKLLILLDELQDSQNIGAIIRSAALFNAAAVISTQHNSPDENSHIIKAACGAFEHIPFLKIINLNQTIETLKKSNYWIVGMSCQANEPIQNLKDKLSNNDKIALIVGNEENGMRQMVEKRCDFLAKVLINQNRGVDSLNAASAAAIFLYEMNNILLNTNDSMYLK